MSTVLTARYDDALVFASNLHREQFRKASEIPYISHLLSVSALIIESGGNEDQAIAGLLHDAAEDQGGRKTLELIRDRFGDAVATIVSDCTDSWTQPKPPWRERKEAYIARLPNKQEESLLVSLADKAHNSRTILADYREVGDQVWDRFRGGKGGTLWYYQTLSEFFSNHYPIQLSKEFAHNVTAFTQR